jgi:hypothetical protein
MVARLQSFVTIAKYFGHRVGLLASLIIHRRYHMSYLGGPSPLGRIYLSCVCLYHCVSDCAFSQLYYHIMLF